MASLGIPDSPGVPSSFTSQTLLAPYNDLKAVGELFRDFGQEIACVIVEPIAANMGVVPPLPGFLEGLRRLTQEAGDILIFDEVITGFRVAYGGAQGLFWVTPDLTCLGKIIGGGLPVGAYGGRREIMEMVAPVGSVYQAGTLSGNPLSMAAGIQTLKALGDPQIYAQLEAKSSLLEKGTLEAARKTGIDIQLKRVGSMFAIFFSGEPVMDYETALRTDTRRYARFFHNMLSEGVYLPPSQFEANFVSTAHSAADIEHTLSAVEKAFKSLK
jgi:glutamate-1-semialdehyde 2,1-aminomutase